MQGTTELREKLATACRLLYMEGLMDHAGLAGARIPETGNLLLNPREMRGTPGRHPGIMTAGDFVVVDPEGAKIEGENNPPSETPIFTGVFRARADAMAVFHLHLPTATLFSIVGTPLRPVGVMGSPFGRAVPVCPDATLIQRREQGETVARALGQNLAVLLQGHGAVIVGGSIEEAFVAAILLEDNAVFQYRASAIGTPKAMKGDALRRAQKQVWQPKVISKMWHYYLMKGQSTGILTG
ncbi:MAG TPA: class II aldolase/adducin family protein [Burkholderiales bacterium]|jgi:ribulose-5-phosphate 4-epimerase/fuculose-1-phosphate aldolase|nr:class II aldolase/adducin family protein [Burkholderiales bacterium]